MKNTDLTILIQHDPETSFFVGQIEEFPAAISQGKTIEELKENLTDALRLLLDTQKKSLSKDYTGTKVIKEILHFEQ